MLSAGSSSVAAQTFGSGYDPFVGVASAFPPGNTVSSGGHDLPFASEWNRITLPSTLDFNSSNLSRSRAQSMQRANDTGVEASRFSKRKSVIRLEPAGNDLTPSGPRRKHLAAGVQRTTSGTRHQHKNLTRTKGPGFDRSKLDFALNKAVNKSVKKAVINVFDKELDRPEGHGSKRRHTYAALDENNDRADTSKEEGVGQKMVTILVPKTPTFVMDASDILWFALIVLGGTLVPQTIYSWFATFTNYPNLIFTATTRISGGFGETMEWLSAHTPIMEVAQHMYSFVLRLLGVTRVVTS